MKNPVYLVLILPVLLWSCPRHVCCEVAKPEVLITAQKNGTAWSPKFSTGKLSQIDSLSISGTGVVYQSDIYNKIDTFNVKIRYTGPGTYTLTGNQAFYGVFKDGKITGYQMNDTYHNVIIITGYKRINDPYSTVPDQVMIKGTFNITFVDPDNPSGISFKDGNFSALIPYQ